MLRLGIIGCGRVTTMFHLQAIKSAGNINLSALADNSQERLNEVKSASGVSRSFLDYHEMLTESDIEAVSVNTPPNLHETMVLEALSAGKHVLCEKPLAQTVKGCERILEKQKEIRLVVLPTHQYVFSPSLQKLEEKLNSGEIGDLQRINVSFENNLSMYGSKTNFRTKDPRGLVEDVMPHILSVTALFAGHAIETQDLSWWCKSYEVCDNLKVSLKTDKSVQLYCSLSWTRLIPQFKVILEGEKGRLSTDLMINPYAYTIEKNGAKNTIRERGIDWYLDLAQYKHPAFSELYKHFSRSAKGKEPQRISINDEIAILRTINDVASKLTPESKVKP